MEATIRNFNNIACSKSFFILIMVLVPLLISGCGGKGGPAATESGLPAGQQRDEGYLQQGSGEAGPGIGIKEGMVSEEGIRIPDETAISEGRTSAPFKPIYFNYDSFVIRPDMIQNMEHNAQVLLDNPDIKVEIQGNCDERGTNEYNLALGEKRAKAARDYLVTLGVAPSRITIVSLGEEKPLDPGHSEEAWAKNRRDDFIIFK